MPPVVAFREGYEAGAAFIDPDINIIGTYHPGGLDVAFTDPDWGATTARQAIDQGADVVFAAAGQTGNGAIIETAGQEGLWCIGVDTDQWETVPEAQPCLVTSAMKLITPVTFDLIQQVVDGTFSYREGKTTHTIRVPQLTAYGDVAGATLDLAGRGQFRGRGWRLSGSVGELSTLLRNEPYDLGFVLTSLGTDRACSQTM